MLGPEDTRDVLDSCLRRGATFAELFQEHRKSHIVVLDHGEIEEINTGTSGGSGLRIERGGETLYFSDNAQDKESLLRLAASSGPEISSHSQNIEFEDCLTQREALSPIEIYPETISLSEKVDLVRSCDRAAREADARICQVSATYLDTTQDIQIANSEGVFKRETRVRTTLAVIAYCRDSAGTLHRGLQIASGTEGWELFQHEKPEALAREAARLAVFQAEASPAPAGEMPVVLGATAGGTMVHEACGHGLEADFALSGTSVYAGKMGELVASPLITVIDDGTLPHLRGTDEFDDEGNPTQKVTLIENGILRGYLQSRKTANTLGMAPTGNGRRQSFRHKPIPRMRNTYIASGKTPPADIIASVDEGLYVAQMGGGQVDIVSGHFVFAVMEGYKIKNGKLAEAVRGATMTGEGPEVLRSIDLVGNDLGYAVGTCGKEGQHAPVSNAQPTLRIPKLVVGGQG